MVTGRAENLRVSGYRSLKKIALPLDHLAVYLGANGTGKTNIYRALELCHHAAKGDLSKWLAEQGGMDSVFWAGPRKSHEKARIEVTLELGDYRYHIELGYRTPTTAAFNGEPLIKEERIEHLSNGRKYTLMSRKGPAISVVDRDDKKILLDDHLLPTQTALSAIPTDIAASTVTALRDTFLDWRFYHAFRVDPDAPVRKPTPAITATKLDSDGGNLGAVFATLAHIREDVNDLRSIVKMAFNGAELIIPEPDMIADFGMLWRELPQRVFTQAELSDGTIQFLALCGALLSYSTPKLIVLNEPETSLHPDMMPALANLIAKASEVSQIVIVTHSERLTRELESLTACPVRLVQKEDGETKIKGLNKFGCFDD